MADDDGGCFPCQNISETLVNPLDPVMIKETPSKSPFAKYWYKFPYTLRQLVFQVHIRYSTKYSIPWNKTWSLPT